MDRNFFLAIALSAAVLFTYQAIFVPPKPPSITGNIQNNSIVPGSFFNNAQNEQERASSYKTTKQVFESKEEEVNYKNCTFKYTNMGGSLHKVTFNDKIPFPVTSIFETSGLEEVPYSIAEWYNKTEMIIHLDNTIETKRYNKNLSLTYTDNSSTEITKTYKKADDYITKVRMEIKNLSKISILKNYSISVLNIKAENMPENSRDNSLLEYSIYSDNKILRKGSAYKFSEKEYKRGSSRIHWIGFRNHYNAFIVKPEFNIEDYEIKPNGDKGLGIFIKPNEKNLKPGDSVVYEFTMYAGPQDTNIMAKYGKDFEKIIAFSGFSLIEWIAQGIYYIIPFFHYIFKSWGVSIILISILIYAMTYPLTMKSMVSMRKMQEMQPKIAALREKYKDDHQKLNMETMEIYRREKINPLGGCLPFLIQMPFFMALYQILWRAQYFQGRGFLWIKDLSEPDRLIIFPFNLPFLGNEINILPILTGIMMFIQQKISSKNMIIVDEQQAMQQKMMMYILPIMIVFMFYKFASSWAIYFLVFYILSTFTQWKIAKMAGKK